MAMDGCHTYQNPLKILWNQNQMSFELGILHWGFGPYIVCTKDNSGLTFSYFTTKSNLNRNE